MTELVVTLPFPPSINSMYSQGIIGAKRNLEEPFLEVLNVFATKPDEPVGTLLDRVKTCGKDLRASVKAAFGSPRASMFLSDAGKAYRDVALEAISAQRIPKGALHGRLEVSAIAYMPDARIRDLDNLWKSALDVLKHNDVIDDDGHIDDLHIRRGPKLTGGSMVITIREIAEAFESRQQGFDLPPAAPPMLRTGKAPF